MQALRFLYLDLLNLGQNPPHGSSNTGEHIVGVVYQLQGVAGESGVGTQQMQGEGHRRQGIIQLMGQVINEPIPRGPGPDLFFRGL